MKITEYPSVTELDDGNVFLLDGTNGTKKIAKSDLTYALFDSIPEMHRQIYRGKNLGTTLTSSQKEAISTGTFHDLWIGDYWVISNNTYLIADFDNYYNFGDTKCTTHHVVVVPKNAIGESIQYVTESDPSPTAKLYGASDFRTNAKNQVLSTISSAFPDSILTYRDSLPVSCDQNGSLENQKNWNITVQWFDCTIELMTTEMITGSMRTTAIKEAGSAAARRQFSLFNLKPDLIPSTSTQGYWTRSGDSGSPQNWCATIGKEGVLATSPGTSRQYIRPFFLLKG